MRTGRIVDTIAKGILAALVLTGGAGLAHGQEAAELGEFEWRDCLGCPVMVEVPAGRFVMGSPPDERGRYASEGPQREVSIERFAIGKYEVTRRQWAEFLDATHYRSVGFDRDDLPVVNVSWSEAQLFVAWLRSVSGGRRYRLPSEAEWEYAARAGTTTAFPWEGGGANSRYYANSGISGDGHSGRSPVGSFFPNAFGLHDMIGNVVEWVADCYHDHYGGAPEYGIPWMDGGDCDIKTARGGSWRSGRRRLRVAMRSYYYGMRTWRGTGVVDVGFRIATTLD